MLTIIGNQQPTEELCRIFLTLRSFTRRALLPFSTIPSLWAWEISWGWFIQLLSRMKIAICWKHTGWWRIKIIWVIIIENLYLPISLLIYSLFFHSSFIIKHISYGNHWDNFWWYWSKRHLRCTLKLIS